MTTKEIQLRLGVTADGLWGPQTEAAFLASFVNKQAPAITEADYVEAAERLGCTVAQIKAFAKVESGGSSFTFAGRPKILFERHYFYRMTGGIYGISDVSNPRWGGYGLSSRQYGRLARASSMDVNAALQSASWGKFQIMGAHWKRLGYDSPWDFVQAMVRSEGNHLDAFVRYIEAFGLRDKLRAAEANNPTSCIAVVRAYNGPAFRKNDYHRKLAREIARFA